VRQEQEASTEAALQKLQQWKADPVQFVRDCFAVEPDAWQAKVLRAAITKPRIAMQACKGPGKTTVESWLIWWFMLNENCKINAVSLSGANVRNNLWAELSRWRSACPFLKSAYVMDTKRIYVADTPEHAYSQTWFCELRTWSKQAGDSVAGETLQGLHGKFVMVVMDESGGMPDALMVAAEGIMANAEPGGMKRIIQAGNPTRLEGPLYRACTKDKSLWFHISVTGDPDDPDRSPRVDKDWARQQIASYGRNHPWVMVNVLGLFPPSSFNALIGPDEMSKAKGRHLRPEAYERAARIIAIDVARFGDDELVVWPRQGLNALEPKSYRNAHPDDVAGEVAQMFIDWDGDAIMVDASGGHGDSLIDALARLGITAIRVQFSGKPINPKFANKRSEILWLLVEWIRAGGSLPDTECFDRITEELTLIEYCYKMDKLAMEEKDQVKIRLGRSPDYSDALAISFAFPVSPKERDILAGVDQGGLAGSSFNHAVTDYDPLLRA